MRAQAGDSSGVEAIETAGAGAMVEHEARVFEDFEVLRDGGTGDGEPIGDLVDGEGPGGEALEDGHARGICEGVETGLKVSIH